MLHLQPSVHFAKVEVGSFQQELDGTRVDVADSFCGFACLETQIGSQLGREITRGGFFNDLLVPTLEATVPFEE